MKMPNGGRAEISDDKLYGYLLNEEHETNPGHATLFRKLLGITINNAEMLRNELHIHAELADVYRTEESAYGTKYEIRFTMSPASPPLNIYTVVSIWIIERGQSNPRLVTAYVE